MQILFAKVVLNLCRAMVSPCMEYGPGQKQIGLFDILTVHDTMCNLEVTTLKN